MAIKKLVVVFICKEEAESTFLFLICLLAFKLFIESRSMVFSERSPLNLSASPQHTCDIYEVSGHLEMECVF